MTNSEFEWCLDLADDWSATVSVAAFQRMQARTLALQSKGIESDFQIKTPPDFELARAISIARGGSRRRRK